MLLAGLLLSLLGSTPADPGIVVEGGTVYVSADASPRRASVAIRDGKIVFVGDGAAARAAVPGARILRADGRFVFPGWADAHGHLAGLGKQLESANLRGAASPAEAARRIAERSGRLPPAAWAEGRGWDQNLWPDARFPDARDLDAVLPDRPAIARRVDGHAIWVNSAVLHAARITEATKDPEGGRILRRPDGTPTGVLIDNAMDLAEKAMPQPTAADHERLFLAAARACAKVGLTEVGDASAYGADEIAALERLAARRELPIRVYATVSPEREALARAIARGVRVGRGDDFLTVRAIKTYADGALGSRGAALLADYSDDPGNSGLLVTPPERLEELAREARRAGWQLWIHAIGDRGNRIALDALAKARRAVPDAPAGGERPRIEHAQVVALDDIPRFARGGVIASVQPTHATSDMPWAEKRLGAARLAGAYAWRRLTGTCARLAGGSDFPVESENPLLGYYAAVTRQDQAGRPPGGWRPEERLNRGEALALFTSGAAWAAFEENRRGRLAPGYDADVTVLAADPMRAPEREIPSIPVSLVIVGGRIAFSSAEPQ